MSTVKTMPIADIKMSFWEKKKHWKTPSSENLFLFLDSALNFHSFPFIANMAEKWLYPKKRQWLSGCKLKRLVQYDFQSTWESFALIIWLLNAGLVMGCHRNVGISPLETIRRKKSSGKKQDSSSGAFHTGSETLSILSLQISMLF